VSDLETTKRLSVSSAGDAFRVDLRCLVLRVKEGPDRDLQVSLTHDVVRLGKAPDNDLVLSDPAVSRYHAEIRILEDGLLLVERRNAVVLVVDAGVDHLIPVHRFFARLLPVGRIVVFVFQFLDPVAEEVVGVVFVERHARAEAIDDRKALVLDSLLDD